MMPTQVRKTNQQQMEVVCWNSKQRLRKRREGRRIRDKVGFYNF
jgi:hypothetical protein